MYRRPTANSRLARGGGEVAGACLNQITTGRKARQQSFQFLAIGDAGAELAHKLLEIGLGVGQTGNVVQ